MLRSLRALLLVALLLTGGRALLAEGWEETVPPYAPGSFPPPRPVNVRYAFGWGELTAATAELQFSRADDRFQLKGSAETIGLARSLWKFDVEHVGTSDAATLRPIQVKEVERARSKEWQTELNFTPERVAVSRTEQSEKGTKTKTRNFEFPNVMSLSSALLYLRSKPLPEAAIERVVVYPSNSAYLCTVTVQGREHLSVASGSYDAIKLDVKLNKIGKKRELQAHKKFKRATVWLSDDADRLILRIEAQIFLGTVFAELQSVEFPNGSK